MLERALYLTYLGPYGQQLPFLDDNENQKEGNHENVF
ncbi:MAG: hypothetical protein ACJAZ2_001298 [Glaciecola sp.]|jgi:hypothetical protein